MGKCIIFVFAKRREPVNTGFSPLFLFQKSHFYLRDRFFYITEIFFLEFADFFRNVGCIFADEERLKLKRYLFSKPHVLLFEEGRGEAR